MPRKSFRNPQEKKSLSYAKDRRNAYGENDKASRKVIPARKSGENRKVRRKANHALQGVPSADEMDAALIESSLRHNLERVGGWKKSPDAPLGHIVEHTKLAREQRHGRKLLPKWKPE
jgi:hypothetical protein